MINKQVLFLHINSDFAGRRNYGAGERLENFEMRWNCWVAEPRLPVWRWKLLWEFAES